jgi:imidazolonepropionase-like amidohydrolase
MRVPFRSMLLLTALLGLVIAGPAPAPAAAAAAEITAIRAGKLIDTATGKVALDQVILIAGKRIKEVGGAGTVVPPGARVIDLQQATVLPGLFDVHTHLCSHADLSGRTLNEVTDSFMAYTLKASTASRVLQGAANARSMLEAGFTTVRDVGNAGNYGDIALRDAIRDGVVAGPTMLAAGRIIAPYGGQFHYGEDQQNRNVSEYLTADTRDELRKAVRENLHYGVDWIKLVADDQKYSYSEDDIRFVVEEAAAAGRKVAIHCMTNGCVHSAIAAGVASIEHAPTAPDNDLIEMKDKGIVLVGTELTEQILVLLRADFLYGQFIDRLKRAYEIGVTMAYGSDIYMRVPGMSRGEAAMSLIDSWAAAGVPAAALLRAMTTNAAQLLGMAQVRGAIRPGMAADIIATEDNPLDNAQALKHVVFVMKEGAVVKQPGRAQ